MDDLQEQATAEGINYGQFCFVSSWTEEQEESIPMWKMYGNFESGIRIKMPTHIFKVKENKPIDLERALGQRVNDETNGVYMKSLITCAEMVEKKIYSPDVFKPEEILKKVEYTKDYDKLYPKILLQDDENTKILLGEIGLHKNEGWAFQKEWRYRIIVYPFDLSKAITDPDIMQKVILSMIQGKAYLPFSYYDLQIDEEAFDDMEIMLSPKISTGNKILVQDLVEKYNPKARIVLSEYAGLIK